MTEYRGITDNALARSPLPKDSDLFLIGLRGEWPIYAEVSASDAIGRAKTLRLNESQELRLYRVAVITLEEVEVQREIVRESLVPKGTAVES